ncbi:hypothetical protein PT279_03290 [Bifidobacterium sp. ESL0784]|uniref:hypothetical protein n=1 Tax=Bifidobacterium sp. ESL0784 TaxID=2983231 RepID=UPI0023F8CF88|nr:hypothetical protein [Bifidobacterium sp. ESL0784]MDF7640616.1 hypothetical protein [Bifidobacterium sp. ESL0784]
MGHSLSLKRIIRQIPFCLVCTLVVALCMVIPYLDSEHDQANAQSRSDAKAVGADPGCPVYDDQMLLPQVPSDKGSGSPTDDKAQLSYNFIQYDMTVLPNGDVQVREHLDVRLKKQVIDGDVVPFDSLSANFDLSDDDSFSDRPQAQIGGISGVTIKDAVSG